MPPPIPQLETRLRRAFAAVEAAGFDALLVTSGSNIAYLTGLRMSAGIVALTRDDATLIVDGRYAGEAAVALAPMGGTSLAPVAPGLSYEEAG